MIRKYLTVTFSLCAIVVLLATLGLGARHSIDKKTLIGRVIARDPYIGLARLNAYANIEVFIVRVHKRHPSEASPRFVKVRYEHYENKLPSDLLDGKALWKFSLRREESCDQVVVDGMFVPPNSSSIPPEGGSYLLNENAGSDLPRVKTLVPCFILQSKGIRHLALLTDFYRPPF